MLNKYGNKGCSLIYLQEHEILTPKFVIIPIDAQDNLQQYVEQIEKLTSKKFGKDLVVSVRSSAPIVMPGMMETILNVPTVEQLKEAVKRVYDSLNNDRTSLYKLAFNLDPDMKTAIIIQEMVFGNFNSTNSGAGIYTTRNPMTGDSQHIYGEFEFGIQGDKIVGGLDIPDNMYELMQKNIDEEIKKCFEQLVKYGKKLEKEFKAVQEIEFTIENGKLYILQTRNAMLTSLAEFKTTVEFVKEGILKYNDVKDKIKNSEYYEHTEFEDVSSMRLLSNGQNSSIGVASGKIVLTSNKAVEESKKENVILVVKDTLPQDLDGINASVGVLTQYGGTLCHAAMVCRALKKPAVTMCNGLKIFNNHIEINNETLYEGDMISIDGNNGNVYFGSSKIKVIKDF